MKPMRSEHGYTLVEIMIAMALMSVGVAATLRVFGSSGRTAQAAQRDNVATQKAQAALDLLSTTPYNQLGLTSTPASSTDQLERGNPGAERREQHDAHPDRRRLQRLRAHDRQQRHTSPATLSSTSWGAPASTRR